jgi:translation initiation factor IF-2
MGMFKVYVGNLDRKATADDVRTLFVAFPDVEDIALATDKEGLSRCFAIVMFRDKQRGQLAIEVLKGKKMHGRELVINEVQKKPKGGAAEKPAARGPFGPRGPGGMGRGPAGPRGLGGASRGPGGPRGLGGSSSRGPGGPRGLGGSSSGGRDGGAGGFSRNPRRSPGASGGRPMGDRPAGDRPGSGPSRPGFGSSRPGGPSPGSPRASGSGDRGPLGPRFGQQDRPAPGPRPGGAGPGAGGPGTGNPGPSRPASERPDEPKRPTDGADGGAA